MLGWDRATRNAITAAQSAEQTHPCWQPHLQAPRPVHPASNNPFEFLSVLLLLQHHPATTSPTGAMLVYELRAAIPVHYPAEPYSQTFRSCVASVDTTWGWLTFNNFLSEENCPFLPRMNLQFFQSWGHIVQVFWFKSEDKIVYSAVEKQSMAEDALMTGCPFCNRGYNLFLISVCPLFFSCFIFSCSRQKLKSIYCTYRLPAVSVQHRVTDGKGLRQRWKEMAKWITSNSSFHQVSE